MHLMVNDLKPLFKKCCSGKTKSGINIYFGNFNKLQRKEKENYKMADEPFVN